MKPIKEGKVREIYDNGESLIMVATARISCFDVILNNEVTKKGTVLTQMSKFWFEFTKDVVPNHMISVDVADMPEFFRQERFDGNSMMCKKLEMLPIECIVRGYITGSGWASYKENGTVCGVLSCLKVLRNLTSCLSQFTHHLQKLRSVTMMKTFLTSRVSHTWKSISREKVKNTQQNFATAQSHFTKNVQTTH